MKLEAKTRLLSNSPSVAVTAAPVSEQEQERFIEELMKMDPAFAKGVFTDRNDLTKLLISNKALGLKAIDALVKHGWSKTGSWSGFNSPDFPVYSRDGEWPIRVWIQPLGVSFTAPSNDRVGNDNAFAQALTKMAKAVMPGKADLDLRLGRAEWRKSGGHAGSSIIQKVVHKAKALGFKPASAFGSSHPAGDWVSSNETYIHPDGWILTFGSSYGVTKRSNSFWVRLGVDYRRGEDKAALANLPQPGAYVRFYSHDRVTDQVGIVREVRNTRLLVNRGDVNEWVDVGLLKPMPKAGAVVTHRMPSVDRELTGTLVECGTGYMIVQHKTDKAYVHYRNVISVGGEPWGTPP